MDLRQLNEDQKVALKQFREAVKDCDLPDSDDTYLLRWLIARQFDLAKAEKMLRNNLESRRFYQINPCPENYVAPEVLAKYFPGGQLGVDKYNNYLMLIRFGLIDVKGLLLSEKPRVCLTYMCEDLEKVYFMAKKDPKKYKSSPTAIAQSTVIMDMDGFSMRHITYKPALDTTVKVVQIIEGMYPELLYRVYIINAPKIFSVLYSMILPFIDERTRKKIQIFSHDSKQWKAAILEDVAPEELPVMYGGTKTDPDGNPNCITLANMGGNVPKSYYMSNKLDMSNKKSLSVSRGGKETLEIQVKEAGSVLKWDFHSEDNDISFAVYRKQGSELLPIIPPNRVECAMSAEEGEIHCNETGTYVVEFDNSFSYFRSKKIWFLVTVELTSINKEE
ncbi:SEC14-like protein 2 [Daphnia pulex]|uniref:SEC14-like protein 2 n=1 Tax=Daphnia pulex TaxID=6669 RepID=UPI001EDE21CC|nr:SEC14-like protein 2 [Daphnia pulex]